jgi:protein arginine kinase
VGLKLIAGLSVYTLNKLLIFAQSAHLSHLEGKVLTDSETNLARARYVRQVLLSEGSGVE